MANHYRFKTLSPEGEERKLNRIIVRILKAVDPELYKKIHTKAKREVKRDNENPLVKIQMLGLNVVHRPSDKVLSAHQQYLESVRALTNGKKDAA